MSTFQTLQCDDDLKQIIKAAFDTDLDIKGSWGYTQETATTVLSSPAPLAQFEHMFASMRAYVEMNMTLAEEERYGSINLNEVAREQIPIGNLLYDKITYEVSAMNEKVYASFISAYKEGYGTEGFNMTEHFEKRKEATLKRKVTHWFEISSL
jgi:predicted small secreted protein